MPSGPAQRPSDVITIYGGKTVEVLNTDAEGRLVLADALVRASEELPDLIVDVATLTGAQLVALGNRTVGRHGQRRRVPGRGRRLPRPGPASTIWPMPLPAELRKALDSAVADMANIAGDRTAACWSRRAFLPSSSAPDGRAVPWAHLDIAGPAFNEGDAVRVHPEGRHRRRRAHPRAVADDVAAGRLGGAASLAQHRASRGRTGVGDDVVAAATRSAGTVGAQRIREGVARGRRRAAPFDLVILGGGSGGYAAPSARPSSGCRSR